MTHLALLLALATAAACGWGVWDARKDLRELTWLDWLTLAAATGLGVAVSLSSFDAVGNHAFRAHEEQLFAIFQGQASRESFHPAEVQLLIGWMYEQLGALLGGSTPRFVATALVLGGGGPLAAGVAGRLATGRWLGGAVPALLLALQPTLSYWRVHGYPVATAQVVFGACLLGAVLVVRRGTRPAYTAWFLLGALTVFLRLEYAAAVAGTAALPLLAGRAGDLRRLGLWLPGLAAAGVLFALPEYQLLFAIEQREDYRMGARFLLLHGPLLARFAVGAWGGGLLLAAVVAVGCVRPDRHRTALACVLAGGAALVLPLLFVDFGMRHSLAAATALYVAAGAGLVAIAERHRAAAWAVVAGLVVTLAVPWAMQVQDLASRYAATGLMPPSLPGVVPPTSALPAGWQDCAIYSNVQSVCDASDNCHPVKDMRDPELVRIRWDQFDGCVYWTVHGAFAEVAGVQHEWWPFLRSLYSYEPAGLMPIPNQGEQGGEAHMYRITERP